MSAQVQEAAREILKIIPLVFRALGSKIRHSGHIPAPGQFRLLYMLNQKPHNLSELARRHNVSLPTMSRSVSTLVEHGLVQRTQSPTDRRRVVIRISPAGEAILATLWQQAEAHISQVLSNLTPAELEQLLTGLAILQNAFGNNQSSDQEPE